jgi:hypothetical protein
MGIWSIHTMLRTFVITFVISAASYATLDTVVRMLVN